MNKFEFIKSLPKREAMYIILSRLTRLPYVACNGETFEDEVFGFTEEAEAIAYAKELCEDGQPVSACKLVTSKDRSMVSKKAFEVYATNNGFDVIEKCIELDPVAYYGMNILDYLIGNTDRHMENWGILVDNYTNKPMGLYPLMDFNQSFLEYNNLDGANCLTVNKRMTQREAAIDAVKHIGLRQIRKIDLDVFANMDKEAKMFMDRLEELQKYA